VGDRPSATAKSTPLHEEIRNCRKSGLGDEEMVSVAEVKSKVGKMRSNEYDAWRSNPANREEVAILDSTNIPTPGIKRIDLQAKSTERYAVMRPCFACGADVAVASDYEGPIFCSEACVGQVKTADQSARNVLQSFANAEPRFYRCAYNTQQLVDYFQAHTDIQWNPGNVKSVFANLFAEGKMLPHLNVKDLEAMSPDEYNRREKLDPEIGGHKAAIEKKEILRAGRPSRAVESAQPGFELRPREAAMQNAARNELRQKATGYENRGTIVQYRNGVPVEAPATSQNVVYRNGRRMN
jgi:hypothetical protein